MAVPKRKQSNSRTGMRRAHDGLKARELTLCPHCLHERRIRVAVPTHVVCPECGYYQGRIVMPSNEVAE